MQYLLVTFYNLKHPGSDRDRSQGTFSLFDRFFRVRCFRSFIFGLECLGAGVHRKFKFFYNGANPHIVTAQQ
jgi:hypothetical protein